MKTVARHRLFWPVVALIALILINTVSRPSFLSITVNDGELYGSLIDILRNSAPLMLVGVGMTLVIATRGIDLSVGAIIAISGAVSLSFIANSGSPESPVTVGVGIGLGVGVSLILGLWNGFLVSVVGIQPIIATLVLMLAGRGIAMLITQGQIATITSAPYSFIASGYIFGLPVPFYVSLFAVATAALLVRRSAFGVLLEAVGINPTASRLAGIKSRSIIWIVYGFSGLLAGVAGIIYSSNIMAADANNAGLNVEVDAILAVVIGGTSLAGGKFMLSGTVVGVLIIQTLTATVTFLGVPPAVTPLFKAMVVIAVCLLQSRRVRVLLTNRRTTTPLTVHPDSVKVSATV
ncbi:ABC transporter permease [Subtercola frigoramans]|uniref:Simple sugar transport system permease protein n=1 Tax=Subtercola frigoramans TaxID=120298 RepID=A0ABS2L0Q5_9MICO|nr:ABC transporter permease [Subtercola frigoramans]MBM7470668.1 simple sugar transport system permease protein [Subtercola frigoramans]